MGTKLGTSGTKQATDKDMANPPGMALHGRTWRVTKRVPVELQRSYPQHYPKSVLHFSTGEEVKSLAAPLAWAWIAEKEAEFQRVRETGSPLKRVLPDDVADLIIRKAIHSRLKADDEIRAGGVDDFLFSELAEWGAEASHREAMASSRGMLSNEASAIAQDWLEADGYDLPPDSDEFREFAVKFHRRMAGATQATTARQEGRWVDTPAVPVERRPQPSLPPLSALIEEFIAKQDSGKPMFKKYRPALSLFLEFVGDKPADQLKQKEVDDYFAFLCKLPPRWSDVKRKRKMSARELAAMDWPECISRKTFEDGYMAAFRPFLSEMVRIYKDQGFPAGLTIDGIKYSGKRTRTENEQRAIKRDELIRMFMGPEFQHFADTPEEHHQYWLPLIGLYTGARINEICQLNPQCDIRQEEGVWLFDVTDESEADSRVRKVVKNDVSRRKVPIHSELIRLGFLKYVQLQKDSGARLLFPPWLPSASGRATGAADRWFRAFVGHLGLRDDTPRARFVGFHAFRSTFLNRAMNSRVQFAEWLTGHASESVSAVVAAYQGKAEIVLKQEILEAIRFDVSPPMPR